MATIVKNKADAKKLKFGEPYIILTARMEREINAELPEPSETTIRQIDELQAYIEELHNNPSKEVIAEWEARMKEVAEKEKSNNGRGNGTQK